MADGEDRVANASDVCDGAARAEAARAGGSAAAAEAADGLVVVEHTVADGEGATGIHDGPAEAGAGEAGADAGRTADGLVADEGAMADGGRGRRAAQRGGHDGPAEPGAAGAARVAGPADGLVVDEGSVVDGEGPRVEDAAAQGVHVGGRAREADDLVVGYDGTGERQGAGVQDAAAPQKGVPAGQGQVVDAHLRAGADLEDPAGVVAADGQAVSAGAVDAQVVCDQQLPARQGDGAITGRRGEADRVGTGAVVGSSGGHRRPWSVARVCRRATSTASKGETPGDAATLQDVDLLQSRLEAGEATVIQHRSCPEIRTGRRIGPLDCAAVTGHPGVAISEASLASTLRIALVRFIEGDQGFTRLCFCLLLRARTRRVRSGDRGERPAQ
jgi:hypothetical protein